MKKYIIHLSEDYLTALFRREACVTDEQKQEVFCMVVEQIKKGVAEPDYKPIIDIEYTDDNGEKRPSWRLEEIEPGECVAAVIEDSEGRMIKL